MTGKTFAIEVIIPRLKGDGDLIPSVRGLGPCLTEESDQGILVTGMLERSSINISPFQLVKYFFS